MDKKNKKSDSLFWGMGNWTRSNSEICLLATKGTPHRIDKGVHSVLIDPITIHSRKPNKARKRIIQLMSDLPRVELFTRQKMERFDVWGNELINDIELI